MEWDKSGKDELQDGDILHDELTASESDSSNININAEPNLKGEEFLESKPNYPSSEKATESVKEEGRQEGLQMDPKLSFLNPNIAASCHNNIIDKNSALKLTLKKSPTLSKKSKNHSDSLKKIGKMYLSDEEGIGDEPSTFRDEDDRNYCSETELDALWNQSDSIEADQYKMDPEADQMKENVDGLNLEIIHENRSTDLDGCSIQTRDEEIESNSQNDPSSQCSRRRRGSRSVVSATQDRSSTPNPEIGKRFHDRPAIVDRLHFLLDFDTKQVDKFDCLTAGRKHDTHSKDFSNKIDSSLPCSFLAGLTGPDGMDTACSELKDVFFDTSKINRSNIQSDLQFTFNRENFNDVEEIEEQLHKLVHLSDKHLPEGLFYNEASHFQDQEAADACSLQPMRREHLLSKYKELLPHSHKYLFNPLTETSEADASGLMADNKFLRKSLEEQTFRRKHCEKQIGILNKKVLELHQRMAVVVSLDKTKDVAIRGIDEMLSKIVEQWRRKEGEQWSLVERFSNENKSMREIIKKQQDALLKCDFRIHELSGRMKEENEKSDKECKELSKQLQDARDDLISMKEQKNCELKSLRNELEEVKSSKMNLQKELLERISSVQAAFDCEQLKWKSKESNLEEELKKIQVDYTGRIDLEKMRSDKLQNINEELNVSVKQLKRELVTMEETMQMLEQEKECLANDKESLTDKYEKQLSEMEKELSTKARNEVAEVTHKLVELHKWEIEELMKTHREEVEAIKRSCNTKCSKTIIGLSDEMKRLQEENEMLRSFRRDAANKMQSMLHAHQQEALKLFGIDDTSNQRGNPISNCPPGTQRPSKEAPERNPTARCGFDDPKRQRKERSVVDVGRDGERSDSSFSSSSTAERSAVRKECRNIDFQHKAKSFKHLKNNKSKISRHPDGTAVKGDNISRKKVQSEIRGAQNTPTRLEGHVKDPPTNNSRIEIAESLHRNDDNSERSNVLRQYIKMMLQQDPSSVAKGNQNTQQSAKSTN